MNSTEVFNLLETVGNEPKKTVKEALLREHGGSDTLKAVLLAGLNPVISYGISALPTRNGNGTAHFGDAHWQLIEQLRLRMLTGHAARGAIQAAFDELTPESAALLGRILRKKMQGGFSESTVNKAIPKLIPEFPYMRCALPAEVKLATWPWERGVFSQEKADGQFANVDIDETGTVIRSRAGQEYPTECLGDLIQSLESRLERGYEYHGELLVQTSTEGSWTTLPREVSNGQMNSLLKGGDLAAGLRIIYVAWDRIPLSAVAPKGRHAEPYASRFGHLGQMLEATSERDDGCVMLVPTRVVHSLGEAYRHCADLLAEGKEGSVIKHPDAIWRDGDSKEQVKLKLDFEVDLRIKGFNAADVSSKNKATFGSVKCASECGLLVVNVTGFDDKLRAEVHAQREELLETVMTVRANSIMRPSKPGGLNSLFLPRHVEFRHDKGTADNLERIEAQYQAAIDAAVNAAAAASA